MVIVQLDAGIFIRDEDRKIKRAAQNQIIYAKRKKELPPRRLAERIY